MRFSGLKAKTAAVVLMLMITASHQAHAQCELPAQPPAAASLATTAQVGAVTGMTAAIIAAVEASTTLARAAIVSGMEVGWLALRERLNQYWLDQQEALKGQAAQLSAGTLDQTRQLASLTDAQLSNDAQRRIQRLEYETRKATTTTTEGCRFDSIAPHLARAGSVTRGIAAGGANEVAAIAGNRRGTASERGPAADNAQRILRLRRWFCDPQNNGGRAGCLADGGAMRDAHVLPSRTIFGAPTLDLQDERTLPAVNDLTRNIIGYQTPPVSAQETLSTAAGRQQRVGDREVSAQMDAAAGLVWGIAAERMPAGAAPEVVAMRLQLGAQPAQEPSEYEIRRSLVEQLWTPAYYAQLYDADTATHQKQIYLRAYSTMQMYKLLERMERISTIYAIQTANIVEQSGEGLRSGNSTRARRSGGASGGTNTGTGGTP